MKNTARDNRFRQRLGILLDLTKPQQEARQEWQASRPLDWTDLLIYAPDNRAGFMSWGFAATFDFERMKFVSYEMPGMTPISRVLGQATVIRTDTTDRLSRSRRSVKRSKLSGFGD